VKRVVDRLSCPTSISPIHPQELCIVRRGFNQFKAMKIAVIGPRSVFPLLPAARSIPAALIEAFVSTVAFAAGMKAA
jgi:hypothetical protein